MFWNKKKGNEEIYVRCDQENVRAAYRVDANESLNVALIVSGFRAELVNLSAGGIAFRLAEGAGSSLVDQQTLNGVLYVGDLHLPIPVELEIVMHSDGLFRCSIGHQDLWAQKKLTEAISRYQKLQIRTQEERYKSEKTSF